MTDLKPCPWCGKPPLLQWFTKEKSDPSPSLCLVACDTDRCSVHCHTDAFEKEEEAIAAWNRRKADEH